MRNRRAGIAAVVLAMAFTFLLPGQAMMATGWVAAGNGGNFQMNIIRPESGLDVGRNETLRLRFQVRGSNPNEKFAVFVTAPEINNYGKVNSSTILAEMTGRRIVPETNQQPDAAGFYVDVNIDLPNGRYNLWLQYYNGSNEAQSSHTFIPINIVDPSKWVQQGNDWAMTRGGSRLTGWQHNQGNYYYFNSSGVMQRGWRKIGSGWYYFKTDGMLCTGWIKDGSNWYFSGADGAMHTGWQVIDGRWYFMKSNGAMATGWTKSGNKWYYMGGNGVMQVGWKKLGSKWYYLNSSGAMLTGWQSIGGKWYYFNGSGAMQTGWQKMGGKWYCFNSSGAMLTGTHNIGGKSYTFNSSGVMQ